jgi:diacylglycerol O-acyltransferase / wax synthase
MIESMRPLDALFLHGEDGISHMHIGSCAIFEGPTPSFGDLKSLVESKLPRLVRYRQTIRFVPAGLGHPVWVDDVDFDLDHHVHHVGLPKPGGEGDLGDLMSTVMSRELDRHRPLWEMWVVEGLGDERWALIAKVHHCMIDGVAGTDMIANLLDRERATTVDPPEPWKPKHEPSGLLLATDAAARMIATPWRVAMAVATSGVRPGNLIRGVGTLAAGLRLVGAELVRPEDQVPIAGTIGPDRRWAAASCSLDDIRAVRAALGGSVNDVVLSSVTGALRQMFIRRGEAVDGVTVRSLVPVSVRPTEDHRANNQFSLVIAELPVGVADQRERLTRIRQQMVALKASPETAAVGVIVAAIGLFPPVFNVGVRSIMKVMRRVPQHVVNTVTTNVPGPQMPLYALGRELLECLPFVPLTEGVRVGVAILSYNGRVAFGVTGDFDTVPEVRFIADEIVAEVRSLRKLARRHERLVGGRSKKA